MNGKNKTFFGQYKFYIIALAVVILIGAIIGIGR
jgi:hypothetical protein